ncbi:hypothetical protein [Roseococcus pinisoli]|uniref:Uncharacterized protein n=1 Tax=Roseococcus pinisoli TaxID=2835040 RepID=A0ABS5QI78_9PROT|nr:hypothetical protein [Roseococcus pinisoli]MBS7813272.1 hypothetical protein [Roseococcus pinisoli]
MAQSPEYSPLVMPVFLTGISFELLTDFAIVSVEYPAELEHLDGPKKEAMFLVDAAQLRAIGVRFIDMADLLETPKGGH